MSATASIHTKGVYSEHATTWLTPARRRQTTRGRYSRDDRPTEWLTTLGQALVAILYAILMVPALLIGAVLALILVPWLILGPALIAGLVLAIVSLVVGALG